MGSQHQVVDSVSNCVEHDERQSCVDLVAWRGVLQSACRPDECYPGLAQQGYSGWNAQIYGATDGYHPTGSAEYGLCPSVQPDHSLWSTSSSSWGIFGERSASNRGLVVR